MKHIAVGSTNPVKIRAATRAFAAMFPGVGIVGVGVPSGVPDQPVGDEETLRGAINRARGALAAAGADAGVGQEGGVVFEGQHCWIIQYCAIVHRDGRIGIGSGARFLLPPVIARGIREGGEVGPLFDRLTGEKDIKKKGGAIGFLTNGLVLREDIYTHIVAGALAPFIHPELYEGGAANP